MSLFFKQSLVGFVFLSLLYYSCTRLEGNTRRRQNKGKKQLRERQGGGGGTGGLQEVAGGGKGDSPLYPLPPPRFLLAGRESSELLLDWSAADREELWWFVKK